MQPNNGFNLKVVYAENGYSYTIPVNPSISIEDIKHSLANATNLHVSDQILLSDKTHIAPKGTLESYGIIKDKEIYLYNRRILENLKLKPEEIEISFNEFRKIPKTQAQGLHELETSQNLLNKLYAMEYYLNNHLIGIKYIKDEFEKRLLICQNFQSDIHHQKRALNAANYSFFEYRENLIKTANKSFKDFRNLLPNYDSILSSFEMDMNKLKQIKLHDSLRTNNLTVLADCIPEGAFRNWYKHLKEEFSKVKLKVSDTEGQLAISTKSSDIELKKFDAINMNELSNRMLILKEHFERVKTTAQSFSSNYEKIKQTLSQARSMNDSNRLSSMLLGFLDIKRQQDESFNFCSNNQTAFDAITYIYQTKNFMNSNVYSHLRSISKFQNNLSILKDLISNSNDMIYHFQVDFIQLEIIHRLPQTYEESLNEIGRRKKFGNTLTTSFNRFIESLKMIKDDENQKRQIFFDQYLKYIPINSFNGLKENIPDFNFNLPPIDTNLPNLGNSLVNNNNNNNSLGSGFSGGSGGSNGSNEDDGFTVIDNLTDNFNNIFMNNNNNNNSGSNDNNNNNNNNNNNSNSSSNGSNNNNNFNNSLINSNINNSINNLGTKKLLNDLEKSQFEKQQLEMKLQTTFLMASKTEEKYKDLLEKSKIFSEGYLEKQNDEVKRIEELKKELEEKKREISLLSNELEKVSEDKLANQQIIVQLHDEKTTLTNEIESLNQEIEKRKKTIDDYQSELQLKESTYKEQMSSAVGDFNEKNNEIEKLRQEIIKLQDTIDSLQQKISILELANEASQKENEQLVVKNGQLELTIDELNLKSNDLLALITKLKMENELALEELRQTLQHISDENQTLKAGSTSQSDELLVKTMHYNETNKKLQDEIKDLTKNGESLIQQIKSLQKDIAQLNETNETLTTKNKDLQQHTESLEKEIIVLKDSNLDKEKLLDLLRKENEKSDQTSSGNIKRVEELMKELTISKNLFIEINQSKDSLQREIIDLKNKIENDKKIFQEQGNEVEKSNEKITELNVSLDRITKENLNFKDTVNKLTINNSNLEKEVDTLKFKNKEQQEIALKMKELFVQLETKNGQSLQEIKTKENENNNLKSEVQTLLLEMEKLKGFDEKNSKELHELQNYFNGLEEENDKLKKENKEHQVNIQSLKENIKNEKSMHKKEMETLAEKEKTLEEREKQLIEKDKIIADLRLKSQQSNLMPEVQSLRNVIYELTKIINPSAKEPMDGNSIVNYVNKITIEQMLQNQQLLERVTTLENQQAIEHSQSALLSNFTHDRIAIFHKNKNGFYEAINIDSPNYFLSQLSYDQYTQEMKNASIIFGTIINIDTKIAGDSESFGCLPGTEICEVLISKLEN
ncbi:hypothetical protein ACTFIT_005776 [Dictyostelium discoideum]